MALPPSLSAGPRRRTLTGLVGVALVTALAGCATASADPDPCDVEPASALVLIVSVHANAPTAGVPAHLSCDIRATLRAGNPVSVVSLDGDPTVEAIARVDSDAKNGAALNDDVTRAENQIINAAHAAQASSDGSDLVAGIAVAADQATSLGSHDPRIVLVDSGLPDRGALNMTVPGMLGADPDEVADYLTAHHALPDLSGTSILLVGVGYTTAPQQPLTPALRQNVTTILTTTLQHAGATVHELPVPRNGQGPKTPYTTTTAPLPPDNVFDPDTETVYDDTSALGFHPDSTELRDPDAARDALTGLARWLSADPHRHATLTGTCASAGTCTTTDPHASDPDLSRARADTIKTLLTTRLSVDPTQVATRGAGYTADPPDRRPDGTLDPAKAARNRAVRITTRTQ